MLLATETFKSIVLTGAFAACVGLILFWFPFWIFKRRIFETVINQEHVRRWVAGILSIASFFSTVVFVEAANFSELFNSTKEKDVNLWIVFISLSSAMWCISAQFSISLFEETTDAKLRRSKHALSDANKRSKELEKELHQAHARTEFNKRVSEVFLEVVTHKHTSVSQLAEDLQARQNGRLTVDQLRKALDPVERRTILLQKLFYVFDRWIAKKKQADLRLAYFHREGDYLEIAHCWNRMRDQNCVKIPEASKHHFHVNDGDAMIVCCAKNGKLGVADDADRLHCTEHPFIHFEGKGEILSRGSIKSAICFPIGSPSNGCCNHLVWIDCNIPNFFQNGYLEQYFYILDHLQRRFLYEIEMEKIFGI
ncbi:hypothetical protein [Bythopirellula goksoeyrii]|uniref:Uncharacterized protein n=1 Tax=Bythopirellula goksoeyrii TaxID=1400387 RepID=A0A5B9Q615_9BACT|nr:hypothetical protein [Bythopirellula goksoeyrii]QEG34437.1 hypothetical protein Pr1d_17160 [Bythopirellula goksoeyrii]